MYIKQTSLWAGNLFLPDRGNKYAVRAIGAHASLQIRRKIPYAFKIIYCIVLTFSRVHLTSFWAFCPRNIIQEKEPTYTCNAFIYEWFPQNENCRGKHGRLGIINIIRAGSVNGSLSLRPHRVLQSTSSAAARTVISPINDQVLVSENNELYYFAFHLKNKRNKKQLQENFRKGITHSMMKIKSQNLPLMKGWQINNCILYKAQSCLFVFI